MNTNYIPYSKPTIGETEINAAVEVMKSGWLTTGQKAKEFELSFSTYLQTNRTSIAVNSASTLR